MSLVEVRNRVEQQPYRPKPHGAVLGPQEFFDDFRAEAARAKQHVLSAVMIMQPGEPAEQIIDIFAGVPKGVKRTLRYDAYSDLTFEGIPLAPYTIFPRGRRAVRQRRAEQQELQSRLEDLGIDVEVINPARGVREKIFPFTGRTHLKVSAVDDEVVYIHTNNYGAKENTEVAVKFTGDHAKALITEFRNIIDNPPTEDYSLQLADDLWIYVDSGKPGESIILDTAVELVKGAKNSIKNCSFLAPDGKFDRALTQAHKDGKDVEVLTTKLHPDFPIYSENNVFWAVSTLSSFSGYPYPVYFDPFQAMHPKLLLPDHDKAFFGSHNLSSKGVRAGTREVQVLSTDPKIVSGLHTRFQDYKTLCRVSSTHTSVL